MNARATRILVSAALVVVASGCTTYYDVPIEMPMKAKLDISPFSRVYVAGFVAGGSQDVDVNLESVRLIRSQLRVKGLLKVIDADVLPLQDLALKDLARLKAAEAPSSPEAGQRAATAAPGVIDEKDLDAISQVFSDAAYWKNVGAGHQGPLIVTGTVLFQANSRAGYVQREKEEYDEYGRRSVQPVRSYMERKGYILRPKFVFIDGRTGAVLHTESFREEVLYNAEQSTPALSSYFELMDRLLPSFLSTLSAQKIKGSRTLLR
jgi:hypothetical protein